MKNSCEGYLLPTGVYIHNHSWNRGLSKESDERIQRFSLIQKGRQTSKQTRMKISEANKGKHKGVHISPQTEFTTEKIRKMWNNSSFRSNIIAKTKETQFKTGALHWNWKGGVTPESNMRIQNNLWKIIRKKIWERDNHTCQICGKKTKVYAHHIIPYRISKDNSLKNLISLCLSCHMKSEKQWERDNG